MVISLWLRLLAHPVRLSARLRPDPLGELVVNGMVNVDLYSAIITKVSNAHELPQTP